VPPAIIRRSHSDSAPGELRPPFPPLVTPLLTQPTIRRSMVFTGYMFRLLSKQQQLLITMNHTGNIKIQSTSILLLHNVDTSMGFTPMGKENVEWWADSACNSVGLAWKLFVRELSQQNGFIHKQTLFAFVRLTLLSVRTAGSFWEIANLASTKPPSFADVSPVSILIRQVKQLVIL